MLLHPPPRLTFLAAALALAVATPAAQALLTESCDETLDPRSGFRVTIGSGGLAPDNEIRIGSQAGPSVSINDRIVTGDQYAVTAVSREDFLAIEPVSGPDGEFQLGNQAAACRNSGAKPTFYASFFRNAGKTPVYDPRAPLALSIKACSYRWIAPKCSRSVTFMDKTFTANRGYPPCTEDTTPLTGEYTGDTPRQQTDPGGFVARPRTTVSNSTFKIRIYGKVCRDQSIGQCVLFRRGNMDVSGGGISCVQAQRYGYFATFSPAANCGPPQWPTIAMRDAYNNGDTRFPPYAEWCDFTVDAR